MARNDQRRLAADARRIASQGNGNGSDRRVTEQVRSALKANYDRGVEKGREDMRCELETWDPRRALLSTASEHLELVRGRISTIPNSNAEMRACREAAAILKDASEAIEREPEPEPEPETKRKTKRKSKS